MFCLIHKDISAFSRKATCAPSSGKFTQWCPVSQAKEDHDDDDAGDGDDDDDNHDIALTGSSGSSGETALLQPGTRQASGCEED